MIETLILIGICFGICLLATPFLIVLWFLHKWSKWCQRMVNGDTEKNDGKEIIKLLGKLLSK